MLFSNLDLNNGIRAKILPTCGDFFETLKICIVVVATLGKEHVALGTFLRGVIMHF